MSDDKLKNIISHAKEYGYVFQSSEIYDGLSAIYDYGQLGSLLKNNIKDVDENFIAVTNSIEKAQDFGIKLENIFHFLRLSLHQPQIFHRQLLENYL